jgi:hypothetical protein
MVGGLVVSQALTLFTTPVIYLYLDRLNSWLNAASHKNVNRFGVTGQTEVLSVESDR